MSIGKLAKQLHLKSIPPTDSVEATKAFLKEIRLKRRVKMECAEEADDKNENDR